MVWASPKLQIKELQGTLFCDVRFRSRFVPLQKGKRQRLVSSSAISCVTRNHGDRRNTTGVLKELARNPLFEIFHTFCLSLRRPFFVFFRRSFIKTKTNFSENLASTSYAETPHPRPRLGFPLETHNASWVWLSKPLKWRKETAFSPKSFVERFLLNSFTRMNKYVILI